MTRCFYQLQRDRIHILGSLSGTSSIVFNLKLSKIASEAFLLNSTYWNRPADSAVQRELSRTFLDIFSSQSMDVSGLFNLRVPSRSVRLQHLNFIINSLKCPQTSRQPPNVLPVEHLSVDNRLQLNNLPQLSYQVDKT